MRRHPPQVRRPDPAKPPLIRRNVSNRRAAGPSGSRGRPCRRQRQTIRRRPGYMNVARQFLLPPLVTATDCRPARSMRRSGRTNRRCVETRSGRASKITGASAGRSRSAAARHSPSTDIRAMSRSRSRLPISNAAGADQERHARRPNIPINTCQPPPAAAARRLA